MAALQEYIITMDPATRTVPKERIKKAILELRKRGIQKSAGDVISLVWEELPSNIGGRTRTVVFDPFDPDLNKVWAGAVTGGLWYNENIYSDTSNWRTVNDFQDNLSISTIVFDTSNPGVMYAGTGEGPTAVVIYRESSGVGNGLLKSVDGGETWDWTAGSFAYVNDIEIRQENGQSVLYVAAVSGVYKGIDHESAPSDGLYRSYDGGDTWEQLLPDIPGQDVPYAPSDIAISASGRIFVGTQRNLDGEGASVILWSDDGTNWNQYTTMRNEILNQPDFDKKVPGRVMLATAPSDSTIVYAVYASGQFNGNNHLWMSAYTILKSTDKGETWQKTNMPNSDGSWAYLAWHALTIEVDPNDPNRIYAGGLDQHKSINGGTTWNQVSEWRGYLTDDAYIHADQHKIVHKPGSSDTILFATDGGIFMTFEGTETYPVILERNRNFNTLQFYTCAIHPEAGREYFMTGAQDNSTYRYLGDTLKHQHFILGGDGAYCYFDNDDPDYLLASYQYNRFFVFRNYPNDQLAAWNENVNAQTGFFINPSDYDSRNNTLYSNAASFSLQNLNRIQRIRQMITLPYKEYITLGSDASLPFSCVKYSPNSPGDNTVLFLGTQAGKLFKVEHAESIPITTEIGSPQFPAANISSISVGYNDNEIMVTFSNYWVASVWRTMNGGTTWTNVEGDLPDMPVRWIMHHPYIQGAAMIATELGIWKSENLDDPTVNWVPNNTGLANVRIDMLRHRPSDNTILAATHGRGLFVNRGIGLGKADLIAENLPELHVYPNPSSGQFNIPLKEQGSYRILIRSVNGNLVRILEGENRGEKNLMVDLSELSPGTYFVHYEGSKKYGAKIVIQ